MSVKFQMNDILPIVKLFLNNELTSISTPRLKVNAHLEPELSKLVPNCKGKIIEKLYWLRHGITDYNNIIVAGLFGNFNLGYVHSSIQTKYHIDLNLIGDSLSREELLTFLEQKLIVNGKFIDRSAKALLQLPKIKENLIRLSTCPSDNLIEHFYWLHTGLTGYPKKCKSCDNLITKFISFNQNYFNEHCSSHCANNSKEVQETKRIACQKLYGCDYGGQSPILKERIRETFLKNWLASDRFSQFSEYEFLTNREIFIKTHVTKFKWRCKKCSLEFEQTSSSGIIEPECPACFERGTISKFHREILNFVKENYNGRIISNDRTQIFGKTQPMELDIWLPDLNIAIEANGSYFHSFNRLETDEEKYYHLNKTEQCNDQGIQLIHIFSHDWINKPIAIQTLLKSKISTSARIGARQTELRKLKAKDVRKFLNEYHLQGYCQASHYFGLFYNNELVSVMSFNKPRFGMISDWELVRYCSKIGVTGGFSKLLKGFRSDNLGTIMSYADRMISRGDVYEKNGFERVNQSKISYGYVRGSVVKTRFNAYKRNLSNILEEYNPELNEFDNMLANGYRRFWNCGNLVYILK